MSRSHENPAGGRAFLVTALAAITLGSCAPCALAQRRVELVGLTNTTWRYEASGADQGVAWRSPTFNDAGWPSGRGLFGFESTPANYPYPFNTTFIPFDINTITYFFRTHFEMAESNFVFPLTLVCSNLVDDGCVVYLNSNEVHRIRVSTGQTFQTPASGGPTVEGAFEPPVNIATNGLRVGDNVIAVEVHQTGGSGDVVHGMSLTAIVPTALSITSQPQSQTNTLGVAVVLSVGVAGGPALFQWQRDDGSGAFTNVPGATFSSYTNTPTVAGTATYQVVVYNGVNSVTSSPAMVTAIADAFGPRMLSANVQEEATRTNRIFITWSERLLPSTVNLQSVSNFQVIMVPSNLRVPVSNVFYNPGSFPLPGTPPTVALLMSTTNWHMGSNYYVSVSRVKDATGNAIAPDSRIAVAWPRNTDVIQPDQAWSFHSAAVFEPDIFGQPWTATNYVEGPWWGWAPGPFCGGVVNSTCFGPLQTEIGFQPEPTLFRTTFVAPADPGFSPQLRLAAVVDDAVAFFLNGAEIFRYNLPPTPVPLTSLSKASNSIQTVCWTNTISVTNLLPGTNWVSAAVFQSSSTADADMAFGLRLRHTYFVPGPLPEVPAPRLNIAGEGTNQYRLWWEGPGYTLESTTNLALTGSGPIGPWLEVTNMSNPFIDVLTGERRFFRLRQ